MLARTSWACSDWIIREGGCQMQDCRVIERPVFVVAPPRSGGTALFRSLARAPGLFSASAPVFDAIFELQPENREWDSNRLTPADIQPRAVEDLRGRLKGTLVDSAGNRPGIDATGLRWVDGQPRNALRVPFLAGIAPDCQFVYIHRDPAETIPAMLRVWENGRRVTYPQLPDWEGPPWSLPLVPGWRELAGQPAAGDRHGAVDPADEHPARRPRGPAARALVRHRLQIAAQRSSAGARADLRVRRDRSLRGRHAAAPLAARPARGLGRR